MSRSCPGRRYLYSSAGIEVQGVRISSKLSSGDEHLAIVQSRSRVKESHGPQTARRREQVRRGIENIDSREGAAGGGKRESSDHEHGAVIKQSGGVIRQATPPDHRLEATEPEVRIVSKKDNPKPNALWERSRIFDNASKIASPSPGHRTMNDLDQTNEEFSSMNASLFGGYVNAGLSGLAQ